MRLEMVAVIRRMPIRSCFCIKYSLILYGQVNQISFSLELNLDHIWTMSFSSKRVVCYLVNQFYYYLLIGYMKTSAVLKRQGFEDSENDETKSSISKRQRLDVYYNEEGQGLDKYESKGKDKRYVLFSFIAPSPLFKKKSNRPTNPGKGIRSLNHLVCILKICYLEMYWLCVRVPR